MAPFFATFMKTSSRPRTEGSDDLDPCGRRSEDTRRMLVLGVNAYHGDASAALLVDRRDGFEPRTLCSAQAGISVGWRRNYVATRALPRC